MTSANVSKASTVSPMKEETQAIMNNLEQLRAKFGEFIPLDQLTAADLKHLTIERSLKDVDCSTHAHRGPQGPNEDISWCTKANLPTYSIRPAGETFGNHLADCSLPIDHHSYCQPGGSGHPPAKLIRG